jgi:hypothetical protein
MISRRKLTDDQVRDIRQSQEPARVLAERHGVTHPTILNVREGRTYKHVRNEPLVSALDWNPGEYYVSDAMEFLTRLPDGACTTVVASPPEYEAWAPGSERRDIDAAQEPSYEDYVSWQRSVLAECVRVAGNRGVVFYHHKFRFTGRRLDIGSALVEDFPLNRVIVWDHGRMRHMQGDRERGQVSHIYDAIFMFTGRYWTIPRDSAEEAPGWGDVWDVKKFRHEVMGFSSAVPYEVAYRCVALGEGVVLDPFAGSGTTLLAAIRARRPWLACDINPECRESFAQRCALVEQYGIDVLW